eukprot:m.28115 g.28115  ORF g.28115 m.28115 type:complete len:487 (-) comp8752_c0_seq1:184-1644(-)
MPRTDAPATIIPDRLLFATLSSRPANTRSKYCFSIDNEYRYQPFNNDFGPFNMAVLYRFCQKLNGILADKRHASKTIVFYTSFDVLKRPNAAFLIGAYQILYLGRTAEKAFAPLAKMAENLRPFRDASYGSCTYPLSLLDCLQGLYQGFCHGFVDFDNFDPDEYEFYERVENGDFNWLIPGRFLAFAGPHAARRVAPGVYPQLAPDDYFELFRGMAITDVVRLNRAMYDRERFVRANFKHHDLFFTDGSCPPEHILQRFLEISRTRSTAVAVHCKAGLGRTGTLIGCVLMEQYRFTASETIGWLRICRPGSVIGPQQYYLHEKQAEMWANGDRQGVTRVEEPLVVPDWARRPGLFGTVTGAVDINLSPLSLGHPAEGSAAAERRRLSMTPERGGSVISVSSAISASSCESAASICSETSVGYGADDPDVADGGTQGDYLNAKKLRRDQKKQQQHHQHPIHMLTASSKLESAIGSDRGLLREVVADA